MAKNFLLRRGVEERIMGPTQQAQTLLDWVNEKGSCENCVFYRDQPGLYCLRLGDCFPETRVLYRSRVEDAHYGPQDTRHVLAKF